MNSHARLGPLGRSGLNARRHVEGEERNEPGIEMATVGTLAGRSLYPTINGTINLSISGTYGSLKMD